MGQDSTLSIVIPVYNEAKTLEPLIEKIRRVTLGEGIQKEIIIVDDCSTDDSRGILRRYEGSPDIRILYHDKNRGKTAAILSAIEKTTGALVLIQDGDLEYDPEDYPLLIAPFRDAGIAAVYGSRRLGRIQNMFWVNDIANRVSTLTLNLLHQTKLTDVYGCYKVFRRNVFETIKISSSGFAFDSEITVKLLRRGSRIMEVPIRYVARSRAEGKKMNWRNALHMYWGLIRYSWFCDQP